MKSRFIGLSLEKCIEDACKQFNIEEKELDYKIIQKKKGIFIKKVIIEASVIKKESVEEKEKSNEILSKKYEGTVRIQDGKIIVKNPKEDGKPATVLVKDGMDVKINGERVIKRAEVYEDSIIDISLNSEIASRNLTISTSKDNVKAYVSVFYNPEKIYELKDKIESNELTLEKVLKHTKMPPSYTLEEVREELSNKGIIINIIEENIQKLVEKNCKDILVAKGLEPIHEKDDVIEYRFSVDGIEKKLKEDSMGNVDFKSIGAVEAVKKGDILAIKHVSNPGRDGVDINGRLLKYKNGKKIRIIAGSGCELKGNEIIATIEGKPYVKNNIFYVYKVYEVRSDVDLTTGNIEFIGDVLIHGNIKEGMKVSVGNSVTINKNVERAKVEGRGNITIKGNIISSDILGGGQDVTKVKAIDNSKIFVNILKEIIESTREIKMSNLYGKDKKDGEIIRILIENKYKTLPRICLTTIKDITICGKDQEEEKIISVVKNKLIGLSPLNIKNYRELEDIIKLLEERILRLEKELNISVDVIIDYCQDSNISSSGNIYIIGKGEYISKIIANKSVYFVNEKGLARGGQIEAKEELKCRIVGSIGGVTTKLIVGRRGHIWADIAYQNTLFKVGSKEYLLEVPSKDLHVYLDKNGDIVADKLLL